jgi:hypothetical protein
MSHCSNYTHYQAQQVQTQTKACQRVCLVQPVKKFKILLPLFKEKIKTRQHTTDPDKNERNVDIDNFNLTFQFNKNLQTAKNHQCIVGFFLFPGMFGFQGFYI